MELLVMELRICSGGLNARRRRRALPRAGASALRSSRSRGRSPRWHRCCWRSLPCSGFAGGQPPDRDLPIRSGLSRLRTKLRCPAALYLAQHLVVLLDPTHIVGNLHQAYRDARFKTARYAVLVTRAGRALRLSRALRHGSHEARTPHQVPESGRSKILDVVSMASPTAPPR